MYSFTPEQNKKLVSIYPYLLPRNLWTDKVPEDYDYTYIRGEHEVPDGWFRLFLMYCKAIRPALVENNYLDQFRFSQIKEKYGQMRLYDFGAPAGVRDYEWLYSGYSEFVCQRCGNFAKYRTVYWVEQLCNECLNNIGKDEPIEKIIKHRSMTIHSYSPEGKSSRTLSYKDVNTEYRRCMKMTDQQFFDYITKEDNYAPKKHRETRTEES